MSQARAGETTVADTRELRRFRQIEAVTASAQTCGGRHSRFHELECGHRVRTEYEAGGCGRNCQKAGCNLPYVCEECVDTAARGWMQRNNEMDSERNPVLNEFKNALRNALTRRGHIPSTPVPFKSDSAIEQWFMEMIPVNEQRALMREPSRPLRRPREVSRMLRKYRDPEAERQDEQRRSRSPSRGPRPDTRHRAMKNTHKGIDELAEQLADTMVSVRELGADEAQMKEKMDSMSLKGYRG